MPAPKRRTPGGSWEYQERKRKQGLVGMAFELVRDVHMKNGKIYKKGSLWRIRYYAGRREGFYVDGINKDETSEKGDREIHGLRESDFKLRPEIPKSKEK